MTEQVKRLLYKHVDTLLASTKMNPCKIDPKELNFMRTRVAQEYGIALYQQVSERTAAFLLLPPGKRTSGRADTSTLKRNRRRGKVPFVPHGNGSIRYLGVMLCDYILFGELSVYLWGEDTSD